MEKDTKWREITELTIARIDMWMELDIGVGKLDKKDRLKIL